MELSKNQWRMIVAAISAIGLLYLLGVSMIVVSLYYADTFILPKWIPGGYSSIVQLLYIVVILFIVRQLKILDHPYVYYISKIFTYFILLIFTLYGSMLALTALYAITPYVSETYILQKCESATSVIHDWPMLHFTTLQLQEANGKTRKFICPRSVFDCRATEVIGQKIQFYGRQGSYGIVLDGVQLAHFTDKSS